MYAIIETGGKQYKVQEGETVKVERLKVEAGETITLDTVLAVSNEGTLKVGTPYVDKATVTATVVAEGKGKKVIAYKYKPKKAYSRKVGHRQIFTELKIEKING
ncbi:MAG: 50S ribosomal protein L21 [Clostridia bacterium]|jgi:large subunit ribosomal protein L21|nr:50S ribosomal protein L21 [Clostridia bacterium]